MANVSLLDLTEELTGEAVIAMRDRWSLHQGCLQVRGPQEFPL